MAKLDFLGVQSVFNELQKFTSEENIISSLKALNEIISSSHNDEFLGNSDWIHEITSLLKNNTAGKDLCLKILLKASKKYEGIRNHLIKNKIFHLLTIKLREETNFRKSSLILYSALIVVMVQGNNEAQNQMRTSGCLSSIVNIFSCILDEEEPLPYRNTELIIYSIIASNKNPHHLQNQTEIGWIIPKVLKYLERQTSFTDGQQFQLAKCFWVFLQSALEKNETNQHIFLKSSGTSILFRCIQDMLEDENNEKRNLLIKMTGILLKMKRNTQFLHQVSQYCPLMILCQILKTCNYLVVQQIVTLLDIIIQEFPHSLQIMKTKEIQKQMKKARIIIMKTKTTAELYQNIWKRVETSDEMETSEENSFNSEQSSFNFSKESFHSRGSQELEFSNPFCVIHDACLSSRNEEVNSDYLLDVFTGVATNEVNNQNQIFNKTNVTLANNKFDRKQSQDKKLNKIKIRNFSHFKPGRRISCIGKIIFHTFQKLLSFFGRSLTDNFNKKYLE